MDDLDLLAALGDVQGDEQDPSPLTTPCPCSTPPHKVVHAPTYLAAAPCFLRALSYCRMFRTMQSMAGSYRTTAWMT